MSRRDREPDQATWPECDCPPSPSGDHTERCLTDREPEAGASDEADAVAEAFHDRLYTEDRASFPWRDMQAEYRLAQIETVAYALQRERAGWTQEWRAVRGQHHEPWHSHKVGAQAQMLRLSITDWLDGSVWLESRTVSPPTRCEEE